MNPVVEVFWVDAWIDTNDIKIKKARKLKPIGRKTVGYLIEVTDECIILCTDIYDKGDEVAAPMVIPLAWVTEFIEYA